MYKVLITTSGVGSRLGNLTKYTNKSLIRIGKKPVLSYIIEAYPKDIEFVITLGYYGDHIREFLTLAYPEYKFTFVEIDNFQGSGSSLVYSMFKAKNFLQCPFIFHACDTIVLESIPEPQYNWLGGYPSSSSTNYRSLSVKDDIVIKINEKGELNYDYDYIGLAGIFDYEDFWKSLEEVYNDHELDTQLSDCHVINNIDSKTFKCHVFHKWYDIGNSLSLKDARDNIGEKINVLDKDDESIFIFEDSVIKFFHDRKTVKNRVDRVEYLKDSVPEILGYTDHFYKYSYAKGSLLADVANIKIFKEFLEWAQNRLWKKVNDPEFYSRALSFYKTKTHNRLIKFLDSNKIIDGMSLINGLEVPGALKMLEDLNWDWLCNSKPCTFHGDFILDNIIKTEDGYKLLDWRQDFGDSLISGDMYYDLGKLNHNLTINHDMIHKNLFEISISSKEISCSIHLKYILYECREVLHDFINRNGYDLKKVKVMTALIWLNMSPLHHYPFNIFLYYFGRYNLFKELFYA